eukprot:TRINITY_DN22219_c0_g1_i1.p1 TRINITY_DN22219_c0_g1~~TRINITY_DN22219_c0_g1_i1.p1  ORF type:complete len:231 (+),score=63.71 TRINITY_DN22219_c0_g1_i1:56-748(+)
MGDLFNQYEQDFHEIRQQVSSRLDTIPTLEGAKKTAEIEQSEADLAELDGLLKTMSLSAKNTNASAVLMKKVTGYEAEVVRLRTNLRKAIASFQESSNRDALFGGLRNEHLGSSMDQRERLLATTQKMKKTEDVLQQAIRESEETLGVSTNIMSDLESQREQMYRIKNRLGEVNTSISRSRRLMNSIGRRLMTNKLIMALIILALLAGIVLVIYFKFFWNSTPAEDQPTN